MGIKLAVSFSKSRRNGGFTLLELMTVVLIVGILAAIAYPSYTRYITQARRTDGQTALFQIQRQLTTYYGRCGQYPATLGPGGSALPCTTGLELVVPVRSSDRYYILTYVPAPFTDPLTGVVTANQTYVLTATPDPTTSQATDTDCGALAISEAGQRTRSGTAPVDRCWRQ